MEEIFNEKKFFRWNPRIRRVGSAPLQNRQLGFRQRRRIFPVFPPCSVFRPERLLMRKIQKSGTNCRGIFADHIKDHMSHPETAPFLERYTWRLLLLPTKALGFHLVRIRLGDQMLRFSVSVIVVGRNDPIFHFLGVQLKIFVFVPESLRMMFWQNYRLGKF